MADEDVPDPFGFRLDTVRVVAPGFKWERDEIVIEEVQRSPARFRFEVRVDDLPNPAVQEFLRRARQTFRRRPS